MSESDSYCRDVEAYLCRKNDGHLVRITGPDFELVRGWVTLGVPLKVACAGIDRYFERYYRRGRRKRPLRIEFCDADVLDAFDQWKRSVGVAAAGDTGVSADDRDASADDADAADRPRPPARTRRGPPLAVHVEQVVARLTLLRSRASGSLLTDEALTDAVRVLDALQADARRARGEARDAIIRELASVEHRVLERAAALLGAGERGQLEVEAENELAPFRARMPADAYVRAREAALARLVRDRFLLPRIAYE